MAEQIEPGDHIAFYVTGVQAFGGIVRVTSGMYEDREKIWPGKPGKVDPYPWRFETEPEVVLDEDEFVPAVELAGELEHVRKWPAEHWQLAFQGQLRTVSKPTRSCWSAASGPALTRRRDPRAPLHGRGGIRAPAARGGADRADAHCPRPAG